jgi:PTH1 family peptidyl-tRNA hydrolase
MVADRLARDEGLAFTPRDGCDVAGPAAFDLPPEGGVLLPPKGGVLLSPEGGVLLPPEGGVLLVKPMEFMNRSGPPLARLLAEVQVPVERLLVACDDVHLEPGRARLRREGSAGGHNGLASIIDALGQGFPRLRLGVGLPPVGVSRRDWVLGPFTPDERPAIEDVLSRGVACVRALVRDGHDAALRALASATCGGA